MTGKRKRRRAKNAKKSTPHHNVYVIELDAKVMTNKKFLNANPNFDPDKACYYVGMTGHTPRKRFNQHKANYKSNRFAREYGLWLRKKKFKKYNPMTFEQAVEREKQLADDLRAKGHAVWQH